MFGALPAAFTIGWAMRSWRIGHNLIAQNEAQKLDGDSVALPAAIV
jgi:hypothetical protein